MGILFPLPSTLISQTAEALRGGPTWLGCELHPWTGKAQELRAQALEPGCLGSNHSSFNCVILGKTFNLSVPQSF